MAALNLAEIAQIAKQKISSLRYRILVCAGTGCIASGSKEVYDEFLRLTGAVRGIEAVRLVGDGCRQGICGGAGDPAAEDIVAGQDEPGAISRTGCHGLCQIGPLVTVQPLASAEEEIFYCHVTSSDVAEIIDTWFRSGGVVERLLYHDPDSGRPYRNSSEIPFYTRQKRITLADCGHIEPESIEEYILHGGYAAAQRAIKFMKPEEICSEILDSGLRGRGGGGYPAGRKWTQVLAQKNPIKYVICNGDEGDPGAFMDRSIMEGNPHLVVEGMIIAGYASQSSEGYIYVRAEYPLAVQRLEKAIEQAGQYGLLGEDILGSGFNFDIKISQGAGAFVCGEGSAMTASMEGRRGHPRVKPPRTVEQGLWAKPTLLNNVETFANVPFIIQNGSAWFKSIGTEKNSGTKVFALTGNVRHTGLIEVPLGVRLRDVVFDIAGGIPGGKKFKAVQIGGPSGGCLTVEHLDLPLDFDSLTAVGAMIGSGGLVVMDDDTCMVEIARYFMEFCFRESCGKCVPCREGTKQMFALLQDIVDGRSQPGDIELLEETAKVVKVASLCGLGKTAPNPLLSTLKLFRSEYQAHIDRHYCPAGVCSALRTYTIDPLLCKGCARCALKCPAGAIEGEKRAAHSIDVTKCTKCGICAGLCKFNAISAV